MSIVYGLIGLVLFIGVIKLIGAGARGAWRGVPTTGHIAKAVNPPPEPPDPQELAIAASEAADPAQAHRDAIRELNRQARALQKTTSAWSMNTPQRAQLKVINAETSNHYKALRAIAEERKQASR